MSTLNNDYSLEDQDKIAQEIGEMLGDASRLEDGISRSKEAGTAKKLAAYEKAHDLFDFFGLDKEAKSAREYDQIPEYAYFKDAVGNAISGKLKDKVLNNDKTGRPKFSDRVNKQISRMVLAWRKGTEGTQSEADVAGKARLAEKKKLAMQMAQLFKQVIAAHAGEDVDATKVLLDRAVAAFPDADI